MTEIFCPVSFIYFFVFLLFWLRATVTPKRTSSPFTSPQHWHPLWNDIRIIPDWLYLQSLQKKTNPKKTQKKRRTENKTNDRKNVVPPTKKTHNKAKQVYKSQHSFKLRYTLHTIPGSSSKFISINILCMQGCSNTYKLTYTIKATCPLGQKLRCSCW